LTYNKVRKKEHDMKLSEFVKTYRIDRRLSLRQMAQMCNCSFQYLSKLENDEIENPTTKMLANIASGMGMTLHELMTTVDDMNVYYETSFAAKEIPEAKGKMSHDVASDLLFAYANADEKTQRAVRILLGLE